MAVPLADSLLFCPANNSGPDADENHLHHLLMSRNAVDGGGCMAAVATTHDGAFACKRVRASVAASVSEICPLHIPPDRLVESVRDSPGRCIAKKR